MQTSSVPSDLQELQYWFAGTITRPLKPQHRIDPISASGGSIVEEAANYITPTPSLKPHQRIEIYNQQYWWRLLKSLRINFPLVTRLLGQELFNVSIAVPYLSQCIPDHWCLSMLGKRLPAWMEKHYAGPTPELIKQAVQLDWAFSYIYGLKECPPLDLQSMMQEDQSQLMTTPFFLQPHIHIFRWPYPLLDYREQLLQNKDTAVTPLKKGAENSYILYRDRNHIASWRLASGGEAVFLQYFKDGSTIEQACEKVEQLKGSLYQQISRNLQTWIQEWVRMGWFYTKLTSSC